MFMKVVPICGNLKFKAKNGIYQHIKRLKKCPVKIYHMVERYLGEAAIGHEPGQDDKTRKEERGQRGAR